MMNLFCHHPSKDCEYLLVLLSLARDYLQNIRSSPPPEPPPNSPVALAFDPHITRKLNSFMPLRAHRLPPQDLAWNALADLFDGWADICKITAVASLTTWKVGQHSLSNAACLSIFADCRGASRESRTSFSEATLSPCSCTGQVES